jgi:hypothetical protein
MKFIAMIACAFALAGCAAGPTPQEEARADCIMYGAAPGTDAFMRCMMANDQQRTALLGALIAGGALRPTPVQPYIMPSPNFTPPPAPVYHAPTLSPTTNCQTYGANTSCQTR